MDSTSLKFLVVLVAAAVVLYLTTRNPEIKAEKFTQEPTIPPAPIVEKAIDQALKKSTQPTLTGVSSGTLPKPPADTGFFGQFAPDPKELTGQNFVDATRWTSLGAMTSRRNINRDIRPEIPIPKNMSVSPWNQSSFDQQQASKALC